MLTLKNALKPTFSAIVAGVTAIVMVSCGSQNRVAQESDGIYSRNSSEVVASNNVDDGSETNYYQQYFRAKSTVYENAQEEEDVIFTDIEAYSTSERLDENGNLIIENNASGYGPWGANSETVSVNIYNYGYDYGFYYPSYRWRWGWGYPYYGHYGYGPYWGISFGWGYGYYGSYGYPGYYYGYPYYAYPYYSYPIYTNPNSHVSYNRGRRNTDYSRAAARGRSNATTGGTYGRAENARRINQNNVRADGARNNATINRNGSRIDRSPGTTIRSNRIERNNTNSNIRTNRVERSPGVRTNQSVQPSTNTRRIQASPAPSSGRTLSTPSRSSAPAIRSSGGVNRSSGGSSGVRTSSGGRGRG